MTEPTPHLQPYMAERWFALLLQAVADEPRGKAGVVDRLQAAGAERVGRTQLSLVMNGRYPASTRQLAAKVIAVFDRHPCPYLGTDVPIEHCLEVNRGPAPTWDPAALDQRRCCQSCPHQPPALIPPPPKPNDGEKS